jgi:hypothetical protein
MGPGLMAVLAGGACANSPVLSPRVAGCYTVHVDSFPAAFSRMLVPRPPSVIQLDAGLGGQAFAPQSWLAEAPLGHRGVLLSLTRGESAVLGDRVVIERRVSATLPADSIRLLFSGPAVEMQAILGATAGGAFHGHAFVMSSATQHAQPLVPMQLQPTECPAELMGRGRLG